MDEWGYTVYALALDLGTGHRRAWLDLDGELAVAIVSQR